MRSYFHSSVLIIVLSLMLSSCNNLSPMTVPPISTQAEPEVKINEIDSSTVVTNETIHINNCGGKGDSEQTIKRSIAITIEGEVGGQLGVKEIVQGNISGKYSQYRDYLSSIKVVAPPGTNMEFQLRWTEKIWTGTLSVNGRANKYDVHAPIEVEQASSQDKGGCNGQQSSPQGVATVNSQPNQQESLNCYFINELSSKADIIKRLYEGQSLAGVQARLLNAVDVPIGWVVQTDGKDYNGPVHFDSGVVASFWSPNSCRPLSIGTGEISTDKRNIATKTLGYSNLDDFLQAFDIPCEVKSRALFAQIKKLSF